MSITTEAICARARKVQPGLVETRRDLHRHPELGMQEHRTAGLVAERLRALNIPVQTGVGGTGVVGVLTGGRPGPTIALRADMDALPIQDRKAVPYASSVPGVMHACGHDGHTAILLGTAQVLSELAPQLGGQVKFLFQPAEEGPGGALPMIQAGVLDNPRVDWVVGLHLYNDLPAGTMAVKYGTASASSDGFQITVSGKGGHGAAPHTAVDAIAAAAHLVTALQTIVSRELNPLEPGVVTVGTIRGGYRHNVIADEVVMSGTVRLLDQAARTVMQDRISRVAGGVTAATRTSYQLQYSFGYPPIVNDQQVTARVEQSLGKVVGPERVLSVKQPTMGAEDFSYFATERPGCFFKLGSRNEDRGMVLPGHNAAYDFDEEVMWTGVAAFCQIVADFLP
ncbi:MAG TPA: amidohydrolase [Clostridiales bacterium UBA8153]|nr:amidohydrolase [Clostridiales bacterium UBA8153]